MSLVPYVVEQTNRGERSMDIYSRLLNDRIIILSEEVNNTTASLVIAQMLFLEGQDPERTSPSTSTAPAASLLLVWQFTIPCSISSAMCQPFVWVWQLRWAHSCFHQEPRARDLLFPTLRSLSTSLSLLAAEFQVSAPISRSIQTTWSIPETS